MNRILTLIVGCILSFALHAETYVVCIGIARYADPKVESLTKTETDAKAMSEFFKHGTRNVILLTGRYATKKAILRSLRSQCDKTKPGDRIIFYFSGHGYAGGFCPYEMVRLSDGLTFDEVIRTLNCAKATDRFIFADACNSGAIRSSRSHPTPDPANIMMFLSSRPREASLETQFVANGFFTKCLLRGLRGAADTNHDRIITASEIFNYVTAGVKRLSHDRQHPVMWGHFPNDIPIVTYRKK